MTLTTMSKNVTTAQRNGAPPQSSDFGRPDSKLRSKATAPESIRSRTQSLFGYGIILGATGLLTAILHCLAPKDGEPLGLLYLYLLIVSLAALRWSMAHALFAISLAMGAADFWVLPSPARFRLNAEHGVLLIIFAAIAITQSLLQIRLKHLRQNLQERYEAEHQVAQVLQQALLPQPPDIPGYETAFRYEPAAHDAHVGGDFLDVFELTGGIGRLHTGGMPIGITNAPINQHGESLLTMRPGMGLFLYTDGVTEARRQSSFYGLERLETALRMTTEDLVEDPVVRVYDDIQQFSNGDLRDDVAMLWIRRWETDAIGLGDRVFSDVEITRGYPTQTETREVSAVNV